MVRVGGSGLGVKEGSGEGLGDWYGWKGVGVTVEFGSAVTRKKGWVGAGFSYDNGSTTQTVETFDLSGLTNLIFGIKGDSGQAKFELVDSLGNKSSIYLDGISSTQEKFFLFR